MMAGIHKVLPLFLLITFATVAPHPSPSDDLDIPDDYSFTSIPETLPKYDPDPDLDSIAAEDFDGHPFLSHVVFIEESSTTPEPKAEEASSESNDRRIMKNALKEIDLLSQLLELKDEYLSSRQTADPKWISSLLYRMTKTKGHASPEDINQFESDLYQLLSSYVIMKTLEERLVLVNKNIEFTLERDPDTDLAALLGLSSKDEVPEELFNLKFDEALLHAANSFISQALPKDRNLFEDLKNLVNSPSEEDKIIIPIEVPDARPKPSFPKITGEEGDDDDLGIVPFLFLLLTATGFLFVLFIIFYGMLKCLKQCQDLSEDGGMGGKRKSKYEQI